MQIAEAIASLRNLAFSYGLLLLVSGALFCSNVSAKAKADPEYAFSKVYHYKIKKHNSQYVLSSKVQESRIVLAERVKYSSQFYVYDGTDSRVDHLSARLNGKKLKKGSVTFRYERPEDIFFAQDRTYSVRFPTTVKIGDSLSFKYDRKFSDAAYLPIIRVPNIDFVKHFKVVFEHPRDFRVDFEFFFPREELPYNIVREEKRTTLSFDSIPGEPTLPYFSYNDILAAALVTLTINDTSITPTSRNDFVDWYSKLAPLQPELQDSNKTILSDELNQVSSVVEKLTVIHDFVRKNIRYIGEEDSAHTIVPHKPASVLENKYGDCKDRACLISAIANEHGISVQMALVAAPWYIPFTGEHVGQFNHMICYYKDENQSIYFDPTASRWAFATMPESIIGNHTLVLDAKKPVAGTLFSANNDISLAINLTAHIDSLENSRGTATLRNSYLSLALYTQAELTANEAKRKILNAISSTLRKVKIDSIAFLQQTDTTMQIAFNADLSKFVIRTQRRSYLPTAPFVFMDDEVLAREDDSLPLMFKSLNGVRLQLTLLAPGMVLKADSLSLTGNDDTTGFLQRGYQYSSSSSMNDSSIVNATYTFIRTRKVFSGEDKNRYLKFCKTYLSEKKKMYTLNWIKQ